MKLSEVYSKNERQNKKVAKPCTDGAQAGADAHIAGSCADRIQSRADFLAAANAETQRKSQRTPVISIEVFPPKEPDFKLKKENLFEEIKLIKEKCSPSLISITYGAGGKSRENSNIITKEIKENFDFKIVMPHLTCVCSSKDFIAQSLDELKSYGIKNILALRGDEPENTDVCYGDFKFASDLAEFIQKESSLEIAVAGYPEGHILSKNLEDDIKNLKTKIKKGNGATKAIFTQFFFDNAAFYNYLELLDKNGINLPVCAGVLPVISFSGLTRMVNLSGITLPKKALNHFEKWQYSKEDTIKAGIDWSCAQVEDLIQNNADGIHFYSLNKAHSIVKILENIGPAGMFCN